MKVLHLVAGELSGGAARGAYWLHKGQQIIGIDSYMVTNGRVSNGDDSILELCTSFWVVLNLLYFQGSGIFHYCFIHLECLGSNTGFGGRYYCCFYTRR